LRIAALKVLNDDKRCGRIDHGGRSPSAGKTYYVTCNGQIKGEAYNVFFDPGDVIANVPLKSPDPFGEAESRVLCNDAIKRSASHPSTVDNCIRNGNYRQRG